MITFGMYRNQMLAAGAATIGAFGLGTVLGYTSPAMPRLEKEINETTIDMDELSDETKSWIGSILNLGALASAIFVGILVDIIGRKWTMLVLSPPFVAGWLIIAFAKNHAMLIAGRFITGFCGGGFSLAAPLFVAEMADDSIRGALGSGFQIMVTAGILFVYIFGSFLTWKWLAIVAGIIPILFAAAMTFIPDSPRYLVAKGKHKEAEEALCWFRRTSNCNDDLKALEDSVNAQASEKTSLNDLFLPYYLRPSLLMIALMIFQQLSGINAVIFYSSAIFESAGSSMSNDVSGIIIMGIMFAATVSSIFVIDRAGRKILLLLSASVMCVSLVVLGVYFQLKDNGKDEGLGWLPLVSLMVFMVAFSIGYGPIPWLMMGELLPQKVKARVASLSTVVNWSISFLVTKFFDSIQKALTIQWCYWGFAIVCAINFIFVLFLLPETKGKSVAEIEKHFGVPQGGKGQQDKEKMPLK